MKKTLFTLLSTLFCFSALAQWKPAGDNIKTVWGEHLTTDNVWKEYPRPILQRAEWLNLNGLWSYSIKPLNEGQPDTFDGEILVPFCVESSLSGVQKTLTETDILWYKRQFTVPKAWSGRQILLNFGAVDWKAEVFVNDVYIGTHTGGFTPFSFDITPALKPAGNKQEIVVKVWDPTDKSYQPVGKQMREPHLIWYTAVSGIWQTVWIEPVAPQHLTSIEGVADIDAGTLTIKTNVKNGENSYLQVILKDGDNIISTAKSIAGPDITLKIDNPKLWDTDSPFLYNLDVTLYTDGKISDRVKSYAAMRKFSSVRDKDGIMRFQLNNKDIFPFGPLDQGWWPDGLYTAPSDEAMKFDIVQTKELGFNMIRKHIKVEPARWYTYCDQIGLLVWQDMPSGDGYPKWESQVFGGGEDVARTPESYANHKKEWREIIDALRSYPSIQTWVTYNEAWGQYKTEEMAAWTKSYDPTRLVNPASGGNHRDCGDILDVHHYPEPKLPLALYDRQRVNVIGEFGGINLKLKKNTWICDPKLFWDDGKIQNGEQLTNRYLEYMEQLGKIIPQGVSGAVYTQITDVEMEVNGIFSYDRKVLKFDAKQMREANLRISNWFK